MHIEKRKDSPLKVLSLLIAIISIGFIGYAKFATPHRSAAASRHTAQVDTGLQQIVNNWGAQQSFGAAVSIKELTGDLRSADRNEDTPMDTASTYKLYIAYAVLHEVEQGTYGPNKSISTGQTINDAISTMITDSDNDSGKALGELVGWDTANSMLASIGITHTQLDNYDSAGNIINDKQTTASDTQLLLGLMKNQVWRERIPAGIPSSVVVADKPGWLDQVQNDTAIVYGPKSTYIITILTTSNSTQPLANLSSQVYNYLEQ